MDFIERWFGVSPDGGNCVLEACTILAVLIVVCMLVFRGKLQTALYKRIGDLVGPKGSAAP
jgi:hypothetical protein